MTVERVSSYPRPPRLEPSDEHILVTALGETLVETDRSLRVLETFHPPTYYLPPEAMRSDLIQPVAGRPSFCEWKGVASYFDVVVADQRLSRATRHHHATVLALVVPQRRVVSNDVVPVPEQREGKCAIQRREQGACYRSCDVRV